MKNFWYKIITFYEVTLTILDIYHVGFKMCSISSINQSDQEDF